MGSLFKGCRLRMGTNKLDPNLGSCPCQADYYFDYKGWTDSRNTGTSGKKRGAAKAKVKATGDGGMKRRR